MQIGITLSITRPLKRGETVPFPEWILAFGSWNDSGEWVDAAEWNDG